ncbi:MAG: molybdopterin-dependent oxidoreductase [Actinomycetota bacterium]|nr:molybdopterin-dependent oxidoreductase [Actinomycetota bacterium]
MNPGRLGAGAAIGVLSAAVALGVGEVVAAFVRPAASPVIAVGNRFILLTPESVKRWAIRTFGTNDKTVLLSGIYLVIAALAVVVGVLALHRLAYGLAGLALFGGVGAYAALTANAHHGSDVMPTIIGTAAALATLVVLTRAAAPDESVGSARSAEPDGAPAPRFVANRRGFLTGSAAAAGLAAVTGFGGRAAQHARFDVTQARAALTLPTPVSPAVPPAPVAALANGPDLGKSAEPWNTPNGRFYRIDTAIVPPQIDPKDWALRIHGMVDHEIRLTYSDLLARPMIERWITLSCVSNEIGGNLVGNARFLGAKLADLLREAGVQDGADQLILTSVDGMTIGAPTAAVMDGRDSMIAVGMNGEPLPIKHGFPARIVVPGLYGYVSASKWVIDIEASTFAARQAYWVQGGWAAQTDIKIASRIDTPHNGATVKVGQPVAIAGVAWDQHVGIKRVEVQVDGGGWMSARLAPVPSTDTWRQWVLPWTPPQAGSYTLRVRAVDDAGTVQPAEYRDVFPSGATGHHTIMVRAR